MNNLSISPRSRTGFTLLEAIITIAVVCILLAAGVPSFTTIIQNNRMAASRNSITTHLNLARSEAVKRKKGIILCPSEDGLSCRNSMIWDEGLIMFVDENSSRTFNLGEQILRHIDNSQDAIRLSTTTGRRKVVYDPYGFTAGYNLTFTFCDKNNHIAPKAVIVSNSGRARLSSTKSDGSQLNCS